MFIKSEFVLFLHITAVTTGDKKWVSFGCGTAVCTNNAVAFLPEGRGGWAWENVSQDWQELFKLPKGQGHRVSHSQSLGTGLLAPGSLL